MNNKFQNKFRIESARLKYRDYSIPWAYFVTICTHKNKNIFCDIINKKMELNAVGKICNECWCEIPQHYTNVELDLYVIMPNHFHGIIILKNNITVETGYIPSLHQQNKKHTLGDIIGKFKAAVTRNAKKIGFVDFRWQERFYDRIIRNEKELLNIRKYIEQNPIKWILEKKDL